MRDLTRRPPVSPYGGGPTGARRADIRGRFPVGPEDDPYQGSPRGFTRNFDRNYDVDVMTGHPVSSVWAGRWDRGALVRQWQPVLAMPPGNPMYDPTDPNQFLIAGGATG